MTILDQLREQRSTLENEIDALISQDDFSPADEVFIRAKASAEALDAKIKALVENESRRNAANEIDAMSLRSRKSADAKRAADTDGRTLGEIFTRSREYEDYRQAPRGTSGHVHASIDLLQQRAPILTDTFGIQETQRIAPSPVARVQTPVLDAAARISVNTNSAEWVVFDGSDTEAGIAEEGAQKKESTFSPSLKTINLQIIAHHVTVSRSVAEDQGALRSYIDSELRNGVVRKLEKEAAAAVAAETAIPSMTYGGAGDGAVDTLLRGLRVAIGEVQDAGWNPDVALLNPRDYAMLDIDVLGQTLVGPTMGSQFWGIRPVASSVIPQGTAYVGDYATAVVNLYRTDVTAYLSDSHKDNFTANLITMLCEARARTIVHRPEALIKVSAGA